MYITSIHYLANITCLNTPEITDMKVRWTMPLKIPLVIPIRIHWTSDNPFDNATEM